MKYALPIIAWAMVVLVPASTVVRASEKVPFKLEEIFGQRPVIAVELNGDPFPMMVHSNASFYAQISHKFAAVVGVRDLKHAGSFGIEKPSQVSGLGRDEAVVEQMTIGQHRERNVPVSIFETPQSPSETGMLGIKWIRANQVIMDYRNDSVTLTPSPSVQSALKAGLLAAGYAMLPLRYDSAIQRYLVQVTLGPVSRPMTISTVAGVDLDTDFAKAAEIKPGELAGHYGGPTGSRGQFFNTRSPVTFRIGNWTSQDVGNAVIEDVYAYMNKPRPADPMKRSGGALGADFLITNKAVIDFGSELLFLKQ